MHTRPVGPRPFDVLGAPFMTPAYIVPLSPNTLMTWPTAYAPILDIFLDTEPTSPSLFTQNKTTNRDEYDVARTRVGIESYSSPEEVLLVDHDQDVCGSSECADPLLIVSSGNWSVNAHYLCMEGWFMGDSSARRWMPRRSGTVLDACYWKS